MPKSGGAPKGTIPAGKTLVLFLQTPLSRTPSDDAVFPNESPILGTLLNLLGCLDTDPIEERRALVLLVTPRIFVAEEAEAR